MQQKPLIACVEDDVSAREALGGFLKAFGFSPDAFSSAEDPRATMKQHLIRIERVAGELNAWLFVIAIGLAMRDLTVLVVKCMPPLPTPPAAGSSGHSVVQPLSSKISESQS